MLLKSLVSAVVVAVLVLGVRTSKCLLKNGLHRLKNVCQYKCITATKAAFVFRFSFF